MVYTDYRDLKIVLNMYKSDVQYTVEGVTKERRDGEIGEVKQN